MFPLDETASPYPPQESLGEYLAYRGVGPDDPITWSDLGLRDSTFRSPDGVHPYIRALEKEPLSWRLAEDLDVLERIKLSDNERVIVLEARMRLRRRAEHAEITSGRRLAGDEHPADPQDDALIPELGFLYRIHPTTATSRLGEIRETARLPHLMALLAKGTIDWAFVRVAAFESQVLSDEAAARFDEILAGLAPKLSIGEARGAAHKVAMKVDPDHARQKAESTRKNSDVVINKHVGGDGADLIATGPLADVAKIMAAINTRAGLDEGDSTLTAGCRRFHALKALIFGGLDGVLACNSCGEVITKAERGSKRRRARNRVVVTIPEETLRGGDAPAHVEGLGPMDATEARRFAAEAGTTFQRLFFDPATGVATNFDPTRYRLTDAEADLIAFRDGVCMAPGCSRPATMCEVDHVFEAGAGGITRLDNLQSLCDQSHDDKTQFGLVAEQKPDGTGQIWTTPLGRRYEKDFRDCRTSTTTSGDDEPLSNQSEENPPDNERPPPF
ncbi:MAG: hypothetical protein QOK42_2069 [Frankiaceae bacterium]|nr:hypothetical protein [Frankiaceae bacterium]